MALVLITGGAGFIGSNLAHALLDQGDQVRILDNLSTGRRINLAAIEDRIDLRIADMRDAEAVADAMKGVDYVLHQAAMPSVARSVQDPIASCSVNIIGMLTVLEAARAEGVKRIVFAASSSAYGETPVLPKVETMEPLPLSPYGIAKVTGEYFCKVWTNLYGLDCVALRYFNVFGPRQAPDSDYAAVIPLFVTLMQQGKAPTVNGDGGHTRDFCYIDNVVEANLKALTAEAAPGNIYNVACGDRVSLLDLIDAINSALGTDIQPNHGPERAGDIRDSLADITAARRDLGYTASVDFREGLRRSIAWYAEHENG